MANSAGPLTVVGTASTATWSRRTDHTWVKHTTRRLHWCKGRLKSRVVAKILEQAKKIWCWDIISMEHERVHINTFTMKAVPRHFWVSYSTIFPLWHTDTRPVVSTAVITSDSLTTPTTLNLTMTTCEYLLIMGGLGSGWTLLLIIKNSSCQYLSKTWDQQRDLRSWHKREKAKGTEGRSNKVWWRK